MWLVPKGSRTDRVLLCLHGGGFVGGSIYTHRKMFAHLAKAVGARALLVGYRLLPEGGGYPVPVDEAEAAYRWLLEQGTEPGHIAFAGDSVRRLAGDHRATPRPGRRACRCRPRPCSCRLSPTWRSAANRMTPTGTPIRCVIQRDFVRELVQGFLGEAGDPRDPLASPLHADLAGLGPVYIQVGGDEALLDDARRLDEHARKAGVDARLDVFPGMLHTFQMAPAVPPKPTTPSARWPPGSAPD